MDNLTGQPQFEISNLFSDGSLNTKMYYLMCHGRLADICFIGSVDGEKGCQELLKKYSREIKAVHRYNWYKKTAKAYQFDTTWIIFSGACMVEISRDCCEIFHDGQSGELVNGITDTVRLYNEKQRRQPLEINLVVQERGGLALRPVEIKRSRLDLSLFYEDDFTATDAVITQRLRKKKDKGIVLLHGLPGTGKTTYLRHLIRKIRKRILFLSPGVASNLMNPDFIQLLAANPDTVLVIEDADNIIMDRRYHAGSSVSNLLNLSDGLMADSLQVQLICTFNSPLVMVDPALLRKGRLIARYEFGKLSVEKARCLSRHFGYDLDVQVPQTLAEIANPFEKTETAAEPLNIGFRQN